MEKLTPTVAFIMHVFSFLLIIYSLVMAKLVGNKYAQAMENCIRLSKNTVHTDRVGFNSNMAKLPAIQKEAILYVALFFTGIVLIIVTNIFSQWKL